MLSKRVVLVVIDALSSRIVMPAMNDGRLPTFASLAKRGLVREHSIAIFPSITPAATAALVTGKYPAESGIAGAYWYDVDREEVAYFGDDLWVILQEGGAHFVEDFLVRLNGERLRVPTLFEMAEDAGLSAACLNYLWFRGKQRHEVKVPLLLRLIPGLGSKKEIRGPKTLSLGDFVNDVDAERDLDLPNKGGLLRRFGFDDSNTAHQLKAMVSADEPPDLCVAYFPENDFESHQAGPGDALSVVQNVDRHLHNIFEACGGVDRFLNRFALIITGDHSQSDLSDDDSKAIRLDETLANYTLAGAGASWDEADDLMACPNMRAAQVYFHRDKSHLLDNVVKDLLAEPRIDQVIWRERTDAATPDCIHVATGDRGKLVFRRDAAKLGRSAVDQYRNAWSFDGDLSVVGGALDAAGQLQFDEYPNAFERIEGAFLDRSGALWVTARPGHELSLPKSGTHSRGSHGSLHKLDSESPLIVAGIPDDISVSDAPRSVDIVPLCRRLLGI